jgi:hypothetical protein
MRITDNLEAQGPGTTAPDNSPAKSRTRFSEVLKGASKKEDKPRPEETAAQDHQERVAPGFASPLPFSDVTTIDSRPGIAPEHQALLTSLVQEIAVEAPPDGNTSVDIQFDARTLEGLHVQIQKTPEGVAIQFATSSEAVSQLLAANAPGLTEALSQRGYIEPNVSVRNTRTASEAGRGRSTYDRGRNQNRR